MGKLLGVPVPDKISPKKITHSKAFEKLAKKSFEECDLDGSGCLQLTELYICLLLLYDKMNAKLPCHIHPPKKEQVAVLFKKYDADADGSIKFDEFLVLSRSLFADEKNWKESIVLRVAGILIMKTVVWPLAAFGVKSLLVKAKTPYAEKVPESVISHGLETVGKYASSYVA